MKKSSEINRLLANILLAVFVILITPDCMSVNANNILLTESFDSSNFSVNSPIAQKNGWELRQGDTRYYTKDSDILCVEENGNKVMSVKRTKSDNSSLQYFVGKEFQTQSSGNVRVQFKVKPMNENCDGAEIHFVAGNETIMPLYIWFSTLTVNFKNGGSSCFSADKISKKADVSEWYDFDVYFNFDTHRVSLFVNGREVISRESIPMADFTSLKLLALGSNRYRASTDGKATEYRFDDINIDIPSEFSLKNSADIVFAENFETVPFTDNDSFAKWNEFEEYTGDKNYYTNDSSFTLITENDGNKAARLYRSKSNTSSLQYFVGKEFPSPVTEGKLSIYFSIKRESASSAASEIHISDGTKVLPVYIWFNTGKINFRGGSLYSFTRDNRESEINKWYNFRILFDCSNNTIQFFEGENTLSNAIALPSDSPDTIKNVSFGTHRISAAEEGKDASFCIDNLSVLKSNPLLSGNVGFEIKAELNNIIAKDSVKDTNVTLSDKSISVINVKADEENPYVLDILLNKEIEYNQQISVEISGLKDINNNSLQSAILDFKGRERSVLCYLPKITESETKINIDSSVVNETEEQYKAVSFYASYENGILKDVEYNELNIPQKSIYRKKFVTDRADCVKYFIFDSLNSLKPTSYVSFDCRNNVTLSKGTVEKDFPTNITENEVKYVSPSGSDSNDGTKESPWKTIAYAASSAKPFTTVMIDDGVYNESKVTDVVYSGTEAKPIVFKACNDKKATIVYDSSLRLKSKFNIGENHNYITVDGLKLTQAKTGTESDSEKTMDILFTSCGDFTTLKNCSFYHAYEEGIKFYLADNGLVENNTVTDTEHEAIDLVNCSNMRIIGNDLSEFGRIGFLAKGGTRNLEVNRNFLHNSLKSADAGLEVGGSTDARFCYSVEKDIGFEAYNVVYINNIVASEGSGKISSGIAVGSPKCAYVYNNIVRNTDNGCIIWAGGGPNKSWPWWPDVVQLQMKNNIFDNCENALVQTVTPKQSEITNNLYYNCGSLNGLTGNFTGNPLFAGENDFHLKPGSLAKDKGVNWPQFKSFEGGTLNIEETDYENNKYTDKWDIGIYNQ